MGPSAIQFERPNVNVALAHRSLSLKSMTCCSRTSSDWLAAQKRTTLKCNRPRLVGFDLVGDRHGLAALRRAVWPRRQRGSHVHVVRSEVSSHECVAAVGWRLCADPESGSSSPAATCTLAAESGSDANVGSEYENRVAQAESRSVPVIIGCVAGAWNT